MSKKHAVWTTAFMGITATAIAMELVASYTEDEHIAPWSHYMVHYVPKPVTYTAVALLSTWLPYHFKAAYKRKAQR